MKKRTGFFPVLLAMGLCFSMLTGCTSGDKTSPSDSSAASGSEIIEVDMSEASSAGMELSSEETELSTAETELSEESSSDDAEVGYEVEIDSEEL